MKQALKIAMGVVLLTAGFAWAQTVYRGDMNLIDDVAGTSQYQVGGEDIIKCMQFKILDSLAANTATLGVVTLPRAIIVKQIDVFTPEEYEGPADASQATIKFRSTGSSANALLDSGETYQSTDMTDVTFAAGLACSLLTTDGGGTCVGGANGIVTVWYTDN